MRGGRECGFESQPDDIPAVNREMLKLFGQKAGKSRRRPWLNAEIARLHPQVIVCLGATAAQALLGKDFRVTQSRGEFVHSELAPYVTATVHPSSILRAPDDETRHESMKLFVQDLKKIAGVIS